MALRDVINKVRKDKQSEYMQKYMLCSLAAVDFDDSCRVANRPRYMWVREYNNPTNLFIAWGPDTQDTINLPVRVTRNKQPPHFRRKIVEIDYGRIDDDVTVSAYEAHARNHEWPDTDPGSDVMNVYPRAIFPIAIRRQTGLILYITPGIYQYAGVSYFYNGSQIDMTANLPSAGKAVRICIYLTPVTNVLGTYASAEVISTLEPTYNFPVATSIIPIGWVKLLDTTTTILESQIVDARAFLSISTSGALVDHDHSAPGDGGQFPLINLTSFIGIYPIDANYFPLSDGAGGIDWTEFTGGALADHDHSGDAGDGGQFDLVNLLSTGAADGDIPAADGVNGIAFETPVDISSDAADITAINFQEQGSQPTTPATGHWALWAANDGIHVVDDTGDDTGPFGATQFNDAEGDPAAVDDTAAADGTSAYAARRDHRHQLTANLDDIADVNAPSPNTNDVIYWNGAAYAPIDVNTLITRDWGSMYQDDSGTTITVSATDTDYIVTGMSQGVLKSITFQNSKELKIVTPGDYQVVWSLSYTTASGNQEIEGAVGVNGVRDASTSAHKKITTGTDTVSIGGTGILSLGVNDLVQIVVRNETATVNIGVQHANLSLVYLGPTVTAERKMEDGTTRLLEDGTTRLLE